jgi:D-aspartate ligase
MTLQEPDRTPRAAKPDRETAGAVILGGAHGSLAVARSLGRHGVPVWFVTNDHPIARYSRFVTRSFDWPGPDREDAADWLLDFAATHRLERWVLFAGGDAEVALVARHHATLEQAYRVTTPPWTVARIACDKRLTHRHAASVGVDSPWSAYPGSREEAAALDCRFPVILKPTVRTSRNAFTTAKAWRADDRAALLARYDEAAALVGGDAVAVQKLIPGGGEAQFSYAAVWRDGAPVAALVARRRRQYPVDFGFTSTFVETIAEAAVQSAVEGAACRFLAPLRFSGLVELEFKHDIRDDRYKLLDVNPRPWTWIGLGAAAGVDFAWIQWQLARGEAVAPAHGRPGVGWTHASRDVVSAVRQIAGGTLPPSEYVGSLLRPMTCAAFAWDDLLPGIVDLPVVLARVLARRYFEEAPRQGEAAVPRAKRFLPSMR